ncbi:MAG: heat shock protein HspQ [Acidobacteriota bacterium]
MDAEAKFSVGDVIHHRRFAYRGVIIDVDPDFQLTDEWYEEVAKSRPPKDQPWYHVLVHGETHSAYVAERNLEADTTGEPIEHPKVDVIFTGMEDGRYVNSMMAN